ncbi:MAG: lysozyme [Brevundimonas sp.]|uniref:lysozyme n=1 Tax=Brevundimonas sp. TaxID=1871086 RepID=UPI002720D55B|nr:lysozyme [Brevundimonas sp.]MDO9076751.1 lysozyme [Brevundimonas sp.]MDP3081648.1 lysozyme [Brevundimonas sp.]MDZ4061754.1 lysozyme [Brevundimonas sp.]
MSETPTPRLKVSREGMVLIKSFEGFRPRAVQEEDGRWIIGYGHTASAREGLTVAEADAELLLQYDLMPVVKALNEQVHSPLNQHQFDALASFAVSVGVDRFLASDVLQRLNEGQAGQAADALIGWPEDASADARLRRRAAERALFVADPASAVTLAELLAAPLPPPPVETPAEPEAPESETPAPDARAAAVASLLGETSFLPGAAPPPPVPEAADPEPAEGPTTPAEEAPAFQPVDAVTRVNLDRYSPYAAAIIGPLPGFAPAEPADAPVVQPVFTFQPQTTPPQPEPEPASAPEPEPAPEPALEPEPEPASAPEPVADPVPVAPMVSAAPIPSPFPAMDPELVLTPATEADFVEVERPVWPSDQRARAVEETVLFEDEPTLSVLRHEVEPAGPRRFDWSETGAFLIMGGVGLAACGASAAAFRLAVEQPSPMGETTVIAWALALIGIICVGVSSWNLYVRWGKPD